MVIMVQLNGAFGNPLSPVKFPKITDFDEGRPIYPMAKYFGLVGGGTGQQLTSRSFLVGPL